MWYVYVIKNGNNNFYIGCSNNYHRRLQEHNDGYNTSTKLGRPWEIVHLEQFDSQHDAYKREKQIKSYKGGNAFKKLLDLS